MSKDMLTGTIEGAGFVRNPLLKEVRQYRDRYAAKFDYDPRAMGNDLRKREKRSGRKLAVAKVCRAAGIK